MGGRARRAAVKGQRRAYSYSYAPFPWLWVGITGLVIGLLGLWVGAASQPMARNPVRPGQRIDAECADQLKEIFGDNYERRLRVDVSADDLRRAIDVAIRACEAAIDLDDRQADKVEADTDLTKEQTETEKLQQDQVRAETKNTSWTPALTALGIVAPLTLSAVGMFVTYRIGERKGRSHDADVDAG